MKNIFLVGPSCAGKTSSFNHLKSLGLPNLNFPIRIITRPPRPYDESSENEFMSPSDFIAAHDAGRFFISWERPVEGARKEYYAFYTKDVKESAINIFSCNNAFVRNANSIKPPAISTQHPSYYIYITAPLDLRQSRIQQRSPELSTAEVFHRLHQEDLPTSFKPDYTINNSDDLFVTKKCLNEIISQIDYATHC